MDSVARVPARRRPVPAHPGHHRRPPARRPVTRSPPTSTSRPSSRPRSRRLRLRAPGLRLPRRERRLRRALRHGGPDVRRSLARRRWPCSVTRCGRGPWPARSASRSCPAAAGRSTRPPTPPAWPPSSAIPVMLKAAAGGGGRGMRAVAQPEELAEAFDGCRSEAAAAFGDGTLFLERLVVRPRHVEVQILADTHGIGRPPPRPGLLGAAAQPEGRRGGAGARPRRSRSASGSWPTPSAWRGPPATSTPAPSSSSSSPETGEYFFIECNPRIQVEHTVTEQVTGIDLVEAQFRIAAGEPLAALGLADQDAVGRPRGFAVQARVVATGARHPHRLQGAVGAGRAGRRLRLRRLRPAAAVRSAAGQGHRLGQLARRWPAPWTGPGGPSTSSTSPACPTNLPQLRAILAHPDVRAGDARTTLLAEAADELAARGQRRRAPPLALLGEHAGGRLVVLAGDGRPPTSRSPPDSDALRCPHGQRPWPRCGWWWATRSPPARR